MKSKGQLSKKEKKNVLVRKTSIYKGAGADVSMKKGQSNWNAGGEKSDV